MQDAGYAGERVVRSVAVPRGGVFAPNTSGRVGAWAGCDFIAGWLSADGQRRASSLEERPGDTGSGLLQEGESSVVVVPTKGENQSTHSVTAKNVKPL